MNDTILYQETLTSNRTTALFVVLMLVFLVLTPWRQSIHGFDLLTGVFLFFYLMFLFYIFNYRTLAIRLNANVLQLQFGMFTWDIAMSNIQEWCQDSTSLLRIGGAGLHYSFFKWRYRAMFNFLEHPRVLIRLKNRYGLVQEIAFSTHHPEQIMDWIAAAHGAKPAERAEEVLGLGAI